MEGVKGMGVGEWRECGVWVRVSGESEGCG